MPLSTLSALLNAYIDMLRSYQQIAAAANRTENPPPKNKPIKNDGFVSSLKAIPWDGLRLLTKYKKGSRFPREPFVF